MTEVTAASPDPHDPQETHEKKENTSNEHSMAPKKTPSAGNFARHRKVLRFFKKGPLFYLPLVILGAVLWGLGHYARFPHFMLRFFGLVPFLLIVVYKKKFFLETVLFGGIAYMLNFYWLYTTVRVSGKLPFIFAVLIPTLLCLYYGLQYPLIGVIFKNLYKKNKKLSFVLFPFIFASVDFLYPKVFRHTIADSQIANTLFVQLIDITGMTGLVLIIMLFNVGLFTLLNRILWKKKIRAAHFLFILPLLFSLVYGLFRISYLSQISLILPTVNGVMIQGGLTGDVNNRNAFFQENVDRYNGMTREALEAEPYDVLIWPESLFNKGFHLQDNNLDTFLHHDYPNLLLGLVTIDNKRLYNSVLFTHQRKIKKKYYKKHLLTFGEFIPFVRSFPFLRYLTPVSMNITRGETASTFRLNGLIRTGISICYEDIFPDEIRKTISKNTNLMINVTNDGWFGKGLGPEHHSILGRLRAIENRRSLFRCTSTGLTTATDLIGTIVARGNPGEEKIVRAVLPLNSGRTIYNRIGEFFSYLCIGLVIFAFLYLQRKKFESRGNRH